MPELQRLESLIERGGAHVLRQHLAWLDFIMRAAASMTRWLPHADARDRHEQPALARWYRRAEAA